MAKSWLIMANQLIYQSLSIYDYARLCPQKLQENLNPVLQHLSLPGLHLWGSQTVRLHKALPKGRKPQCTEGGKQWKPGDYG